ncbi:FkbM family methyltransferase [Candidatus Pelagibacter sp.]|nr:FkbM family methyltransferase [Candidatus Pelagibacter sp.]
MQKIIKKYIKKIIRKLGWRIDKIRQNSFYNLEKPNEHLIEAMVNCSGIIHIGAHRGEEAPIYEWFGKKVLWFEANPLIMNDLKDNIFKYKHQKVFEALILDSQKKIKFNLSNNDFASSSIFNFGKLSEGKDSLWPEKNLKMIKSIFLESNSFDQIVLDKKIEIKSFDHWVIDTQGAELLFLHGAKKSLNYCKSIFIEVSNAEIYDKGSKWSDVKDFLNSNGFNQVTELNSDHTDVLFIKKSF